MRRATLLAVGLLALLAVAPPAGGVFAAARGGSCSATVLRGELPVWARGGFHGSFRVPHRIANDGTIAAILFGDPLSSPESKLRANKVLWVQRRREAGADMIFIRARLVGGTSTAYRRLALGPSYLNLPAVGCWRLSLRFGSQSDTLDLLYTASPSQ